MGAGTTAGHAFISYVREDSPEVDRLQSVLESAGIRVWRDTVDLGPGQVWQDRIREAITGDALVFIACFSRNSVARGRSYQNEELMLAVEQFRLRPPDAPWLIPVRFDECGIPDRNLGGGLTLSSIQRVDLFGEHYDQSAAKLVEVVKDILGSPYRTSSPDGGADPAAVEHQRVTPAPARGQEPHSNPRAETIHGLMPDSTSTGSRVAEIPGIEVPSSRSPARETGATRNYGVMVRWMLLGIFLVILATLSISADQPDLTPTLRFPSWVSAVAFSPNDRLLACGTGDTDDKVTLWDITNVAKPILLSTLIGYGRTVRTVVFSPDGHLLATASWDGTVALWDVTTPGQPRRIYTDAISQNMVEALAFSPNGKILAAGDSDQLIFMWNLTYPTRPTLIGRPFTGHAGFVRNLAFSPDGQTLATANAEHVVILWDLANPAKPVMYHMPLDSYSGFESAAVFSKNGEYLAAGSTNGTVTLWKIMDPARPDRISMFNAFIGDWVMGEAYSPDGKTLATANRPDAAVLWDVSNPAEPRQTAVISINNGRPRYVEAVAFSPDGKWLAIASFNHTVTLWRM
jgi:WD40 repeat protein